jgi:hypothetical protein
LIAGKNSSLPSAGTPLGIRFYSAASLIGSTHYITVSNSATAWQWLNPVDPPSDASLTLSLDRPGMLIEDGTPAGSAVGVPVAGSFSTTLPIPEPSAFALQAMVALCGFFGRTRGRRRK